MLGKSYDKEDLEDVMENLGCMLACSDFVGMTPSEVWDLFLNSYIPDKIELGDPRYVVGMSGSEYLLLILEDNLELFEGLREKLRSNMIDNDRCLWAGYAMARLQYETTMPFRELNKYIPIDYVLSIFNPLHEADLSKFVDIANERIYRLKGNSLKNMRKRCGYTQKDLARVADVDIRNIQMYEQRKNDINKASVDILDRLSKALHCSIYDLLERTIM